MKQVSFDAIIIGFGKAGKTLAGALAKANKRVALIEKSKEMYGGTCINIACIPTKTLASSAAQGLSFDDAMQRRGEVVGRLNTKNYHMLADNPGVTVIDGVASFEDNRTVRVTAGDETLLLTSDQIFINTGATPVIPAIPGLESSTRAFTSTEMLLAQQQPKRLAVIGGGFIGLEFASTFAQLGTKVTVFNRSDKLAASEDPSMAAAIESTLVDQGITIVHNANITQVSDTDAGVAVTNHAETAEFDAVLVATGRRPFTDGLNLAAAGVDMSETGAIIVNDKLETSAPGIYAMGDVTGAPQFTYLSLDDFRILRSQLLGDGSYTRAQRSPLVTVVFMQTPYARIGMTEAEARQTGRQIAVKEMPAAVIPRLHVDGKLTGLLRAIVDTDTQEILGAALLCQNAHEVINIIKTAVDNQLPYTVLRDQIFTHPTVSESLNDLFAI